MKQIAQKWQPPKWWLISNETVEEIKRLLEALPSDDVAAVTHEFLTGLWVSNIQPADVDPPKDV